jgi:hypothetical protein
MDADIANFQLPIANRPDRQTPIENRQSLTGNQCTHPLPRTVLML